MVIKFKRMKFLKVIVLLLVPVFAFSQSIKELLSSAIISLEKNAAFAHASVSMYVIDSKTGTVVYDKNAQLGMAPASTQKIITCVTAFELLGKDFTYKTQFGYDGSIAGNTLNGNLYFIGSGDPSLGSSRWKQTSEETLLKKIIAALKAKNIFTIKGNLIVDASQWETQATPRGWIWEDVGNYYGAGVWGVNWNENQYDLVLKPGKNEGDPVTILRTVPALEKSVLVNELKTGKAGSGDNSIIYLPENGCTGTVRGTVPAGPELFIVKAAIPNAPQLFLKTMQDNLATNKIELLGKGITSIDLLADNKPLKYNPTIFLSIASPTLDSINYWFLKKSVNLFGEAFLKTMAFKKTGSGSADSGLAIIKNFWSKRGIEKSALKILDGSGLSPANRITTHALVTVLQYAKEQDWFNSFYNALPEMNAIKMKDGYISGVRSYAGYIKSKSGAAYTFALIVNNFDGSAATAREKMWKVLDILK